LREGLREQTLVSFWYYGAGRGRGTYLYLEVEMDRLLGKIGLAVALILLGTPSWGQAPWAAAARAAKTLQYDRGTVETLSGRVIEVDHLGPRRLERLSQVHLLLETGGERVIVRLGPESWLAQHNFNLVPGDLLTITGSRIDRPRQSFLIAGKIRKGNQVMPFRDENGRPLWARGLGQIEKEFE